MSILAYLQGKMAAAETYGVKLSYEYGSGSDDRPGTEYGPRYLQSWPDDRKRVKDQVGMLFDNFPSYDPDSHFPVPGTNNQFVEGGNPAPP